MTVNGINSDSTHASHHQSSLSLSTLPEHEICLREISIHCNLGALVRNITRPLGKQVPNWLFFIDRLNRKWALLKFQILVFFFTLQVLVVIENKFWPHIFIGFC